MNGHGFYRNYFNEVVNDIYLYLHIIKKIYKISNAYLHI